MRLKVDLGNLKEAHSLVVESSNLSNTIQASEVATLITAWAKKGDEANLRVAWSLYLDLRRRLGAHMSLEDYDQISMAFLAAERTELALAVFKDMVLRGQRLEWDSVEISKKTLGTFRRLQVNADTLDDLTQISLSVLTSMPKRLENKYFYASWIKRLIGIDEVDSAIPVLALMYERGIRPDPLHLNGIASAWLREKDKSRESLALQILWSMVKERLKLVARREASETGTQLPVEIPDLGVQVPPFISLNLPPANIETFSVLLLHYESRNMQTSMKIVDEMLGLAKIPPNAFIWNQRMILAQRRGEVFEAWRVFVYIRAECPVKGRFSVSTSDLF